MKLLLSALLLFLAPARTTAANTTEDFESLPTAPVQWTSGVDITSGHGGWSFSGGTATALTVYSVSGDQSLRFWAGSTAPEQLSHSIELGGGGYAFLMSLCASR